MEHQKDGRDEAIELAHASANSSATQSADEARESRRRFLQRGALAGGGLVLGLAGRGAIAAEANATQNATGADSTQATQTPSEIVLKLGEHKELSLVGSSQIIETRDDKIIVARTEEAKFVACSAVCTHKGCLVVYDHPNKQFACPCHKARYSLDGQVVRGPARLPLKQYSTDTAAVVSLKKK